MTKLFLYSSVFSNVAVTADQDLFSVVAPTDAKLIVPKVVIGQSSDFGDVQAEMAAIAFIRGYTTVGSGGGAVTPVPWRSSEAAAAHTVRINDDTIASSGSPETVWGDTFNVMAGYLWDQDINWADPEVGQIVVDPGVRLVVRLLANPTDSLTMSGGIIIGELR